MKTFDKPFTKLDALEKKFIHNKPLVKLN